jgi:hypothetical protein
MLALLPRQGTHKSPPTTRLDAIGVQSGGRGAYMRLSATSAHDCAVQQARGHTRDTSNATAGQVPLRAIVAAMKQLKAGQKLPVLANIVDASCETIEVIAMLAGGNDIIHRRDGGAPASS